MITSLAGSRVVVTRGRHQAEELNARLRARGAVPIPYPCIAIVPPRCPQRLDTALRAAAAGEFDRLVLTSANSAVGLRRRLDLLGITLSGLRVAAVGPSTADAVRRWLDLDVQYVPDVFVAEDLAAQLSLSPSERILLPQADIAGPSLAKALAQRGGRITRVDAYRTERGRGGARLLARLRAGRIDAVTLASASAARHFFGRLRAEGGSPRDLAGVAVACIGPRTEAMALRYRLPATAVATTHTLDGLVTALERALETEPDRRTTR
jgi:uroporphyrinogen-III synthase